MFNFIKISLIQGDAYQMLNNLNIPEELTKSLVYNSLSKNIILSVLENGHNLAKHEKGVIASLLILELASLSNRDRDDAVVFYNEKKLIIMSILANDIQSKISNLDIITRSYCRAYEDSFGSKKEYSEFESSIQQALIFNNEMNALGL